MENYYSSEEKELNERKVEETAAGIQMFGAVACMGFDSDHDFHIVIVKVLSSFITNCKIISMHSMWYSQNSKMKS